MNELFGAPIQGRQTGEWAAGLYPFTPLELARLALYRAAIDAGCFTDWPDREAADGHPLGRRLGLR